MIDKKLVRECSGYLALFLFLAHVVMRFMEIGVFGPSRGDGFSANFCFGSLALLFIVFSVWNAILMTSSHAVSYRVNVVMLMVDALFVLSLIVSGAWTWYYLLMGVLYGPTATLIEWFTKPDVIQERNK